MCTITIAARCIRAVMPCAATADIRYYLNSIALKRGKAGGVVAVGTDGNTLAFAFDPNGEWKAEGDTIIIRRANGQTRAKNWKDGILADIAALKPGSLLLDAPAEIFTKGGANAACSFAGVTREGAAIEDARFPDVGVWARPTFTGEPSGFNPELLAKAFEGASFFGSRKHPGAIVFQNGEKAGTVLPTTPDRFAAVVMPLRTDHKIEWAAEARPVPGLDWLSSALC